jgi:hypothetical protein
MNNLTNDPRSNFSLNPNLRKVVSVDGRVVEIDSMAAKDGRRCPVCDSQSCTKAWDDCASCDTERGSG